MELSVQLLDVRDKLAANDPFVLHERNAHMARRVLELAREAPSGRVLVVTDMARVPALLYALHHAGCTPAAGQPCAACVAHRQAGAAQAAVEAKAAAAAADEAWKVCMPAMPW